MIVTMVAPPIGVATSTSTRFLAAAGWLGLLALQAPCVSAPRNVPELDAAACLKAQGPGKWSTAVRKHHGPRRWNFVVPVGEGLGCVRRNGTASDWHENVDALGFDFDSCPLERLSLKRMCSKLAGRRLLFVGDSLQVHLFVEFYMMANHSRTGTHGMCKHYTCRPQRICTDHVPGGILVEVMRDDWLSLPGDHAPRDVNGKKPMVHSNQWLRHVTNQTVAIITPGSHYWKPSLHRQHVERFAVCGKRWWWWWCACVRCSAVRMYVCA